MTHTYHLFKANVFQWRESIREREKINKKIVSLRKLYCFSFSLLSISFQAIGKLTSRRIKCIVLVTFTLVVARSMVRVALGFFLAVWTNLQSSRKLCALFYYVLVERLFAFSICRQTGVGKLLVQSVARSSAVRLLVRRSCLCEM